MDTDYIIERADRSEIYDFYYIALNTLKNVTFLKEALPTIYNIIYINTVKILIVNSETELIVSREALQRLFNPYDKFSLSGQAYTMESCVEEVRENISHLTFYDGIWEDRLDDIELQRGEAISRFYDDHRIGLRDVLAGRSQAYTNWFMDRMTSKYMLKYNVQGISKKVAKRAIAGTVYTCIYPKGCNKFLTDTVSGEVRDKDLWMSGALDVIRETSYFELFEEHVLIFFHAQRWNGSLSGEIWLIRTIIDMMFR